MKFLRGPYRLADSLYTAYTMENVSQAEQLYIIADLILGPAPDPGAAPHSDAAASQAQTYASLQNISQFSDTLISIENLIVSPDTAAVADRREPATLRRCRTIPRRAKRFSCIPQPTVAVLLGH